MNQPTILLFNIPLIKAAQIAKLCADLGIEAKQVSNAENPKTIGELAELSSLSPLSAKTDKQPFPQGEMLVFCGLLPDKFDTFLAEYKKRGIPEVPLKAVLTPYNANWTPGKLYAELSREHAAINRPSSSQNKKG